MQKVLAITGIVLLVVLGVSLGWWLRGFKPVIIDPVVQVDTLWMHDTVSIIKPVYNTEKVTKTDTLKIEIPGQKDTVYVPVPITQKYYHDKDYEAWVSGYRPALDSIRVFQSTAIVEKVVYKDTKKPWGIGIQVGGTYLPKTGFTPYFGVGISYNILTF